MPNTLDFPSIRGWIKSCKSHHGGSCEDKTHTGVGPKILIDCRERQLCSNVGSPYACLSYVWGALEVPIHRLSGDVLPEVLPQTVSDAMAVTLRIGLRYLWIDRYCIDQSDAEAKHDAILNMDIIYRGAELTIIAASGTGPDHGLPGVSKARAPRPILTIGSHTLVATEHPRREIEFSKWSTRGWTYQEVLLSSRRLVFTDTQVYFQCKSSYTLEGWGRPQEALSRNSRLMLAAFPEISGISRVSSVYSRLEEYYRRELSYQSDIIDAFTGIFRALQSLQQHGSGPRANHFYGIPIIYNRPQDGSNKGILINAEFSFGLGLAWKVHHQSFNFARFNRLGQPIMSGDQTLYRLPVPQNPFPSWTWAAFKASQPHSDPGQLSFPFQRVPGDEGKDDDYLEVNIFHNSGVKMSLRQYLLKGEDYINFRPVMEITALVISGWLTLDRHGTIGYSAFPGYVLHLHDPPESIENKLMAICVGSAGRDNTADYPVVIIVEEVETEPGAIPEYRHIGICPWSKGFIGKAARPSTTSLEVMSKGSPWHRQTLRLV
ncbi:HET-domain-containing protein [Ophiobolus disseminans]|uniref:HET-domain-containing protein n=1 Tax=Ophiobolus disseminans TaxID=1469910 RepID=A0A6A6ZEY0_9PLEO|nr:HET-domain-containing protein [Ophiobolus disseminans]